MLETGSYILTMDMRLEALAAGEGLRWSLRCMDNKLINQSEILSGHVNWKKYQISFSVPDQVGCETQTISLDSIPGGARPFDYQGALWVDHIVIKKSVALD